MYVLPKNLRSNLFHSVDTWKSVFSTKKANYRELIGAYECHFPHLFVKETFFFDYSIIGNLFHLNEDQFSLLPTLSNFNDFSSEYKLNFKRNFYRKIYSIIDDLKHFYLFVV